MTIEQVRRKLLDHQALKKRPDYRNKFHSTLIVLPSLKMLEAIINFLAILYCGITLKKKFYSGSALVAGIMAYPKSESWSSFHPALFTNLKLLTDYKKKNPRSQRFIMQSKLLMWIKNWKKKNI